MKIAFIDVVGLTYNGDTVGSRGLGGSESAVIYMAEELAKLGHDVNVHCSCEDADTKSGTFNDVQYIDHSSTNTYAHGLVYDVVVSVRSVAPFMEGNPYCKSAVKSKHRVLWMHDTFCEGDEHIEPMVNQGFIDEIFTLSDFHTNYVLNATHGPRRNYEVLKDKVFQTRNGITKWQKPIPLDQKIPRRFVYNASATKGMVPLLNDIWPEISRRFPDAHLDVIGGYYRFKDGAADDQEKTVRAYMQSPPDNVTLHGVIPQYKVAEIVSKAQYMLYPPAFPETFGISTLESLYYRTPVITSNFGALEETAIDMACFKMNYAIEPNGLFPHINKQDQINEFIELTCEAVKNPYLTYQKQNYCGVIDDICGWNTVALQWDQHFHQVFDTRMSVEAYRKVKKINDKVDRVFGRRNRAAPALHYSKRKEPHIHVVTPVWNAEKYIEQCVASVISQDYDNYSMRIIDDNSDDMTPDLAWNYANDYPKVYLEECSVRNGCIRNQSFHITEVMRSLKDDDIIVLLDGDDWLINNPDVFNYISEMHEKHDMTYGSTWSLADKIPLIAQDIPDNVNPKDYGKANFPWNIPYTHLRTMKYSLAKRVNWGVCKDANGKWMMSGADNPLFWEMYSKAGSPYANKEVIHVYNDTNPLNDYKINTKEQNRNAGI